ncbi:MAG: hypothetical protein ACOCZ6_03300 [Nanoarchaeota archaeon]
MRKKRGQAALEFLMTYGWAFLVIMIMIGALAYFGILTPQKFLPDRCQFGNPIMCHNNEFVIQSSNDATIMARLTNNGGSNIYIYDFEVSTDYAGNICDVSNSATQVCLDQTGGIGCDATDENIKEDEEEIRMDAGDAHHFVIDCNGGTGLTPGDKVKFRIEGKYYPTSSSERYAKSLSGEIYATVTEP